MDMQRIMDVIMLVGMTAWTVVAIIVAWRLLFKTRIAPDRKELSSFDESENGTSEEFSDLKRDMNAKFSEINGKFDAILILLDVRAKLRSAQKADSSKHTNGRSKQHVKSE